MAKKKRFRHIRDSEHLYDITRKLNKNEDLVYKLKQSNSKDIWEEPGRELIKLVDNGNDTIIITLCDGQTLEIDCSGVYELKVLLSKFCKKEKM